jgi:hypothetical protein
MEEELYNIFLKSPPNLFDEFVNECQKTFDKPAHTMLELRNRTNKKLKGDKFEVFCLHYLYEIYELDNVWRLEDVPDSVLLILGMKRRDMGIDIIGEKGGKYYAIQCKYKKYKERKNVLTWKELSTFYALCLKTGPWEKYIVMTNCDYTRQAVKTEKDLIICKKKFQSITKSEWLRMCNKEGNQIKEEEKAPQKEEEKAPQKEEEKKVILNTNSRPKNIEELRKLRLEYYDKRNII